MNFHQKTYAGANNVNVGDGEAGEAKNQGGNSELHFQELIVL
jgi:hypothetical protein